MSETNPNPMAPIDNDDFMNAAVRVEDQQFGSIYPVVQFVNGAKDKKALGEDNVAFTGGFFIAEEQGIEIPGFEPYVLTTRDGTEIPGFASRDIEIAPIRWRRCWNSQPADTKALSRRFGWDEYDEALAYGSPRGRAQLLVDVVGVDEPLLLSFGGFGAKSVMSQGTDRGILPRFSSKVRDVATKARQKARPGQKLGKMPMLAFRLTIGPARDDKGKVDHTEVGQKGATSIVTLPMWVKEPAGLASDAELKRLFVGNERLALLQDLHDTTDDWQSAWTSEVLSTQGQRGKESRQMVPANGAGHATGIPAENNIPF